MRSIILTLIVCFHYSFSQNSYNLSGKVTDEKSNQIMVGDAVLLQNNTVVKYTSINKGRFIFEAIPQENYTLKIYSLGYQTYLQEITLDKELKLTITLKEATTTLDEVLITATKKLIENNNGNVLATIENTVLSKEPSIIDLMSKLPSVQVSANREAITIVGRGTPLIYQGNQQISIEEFMVLPVDDIKTGEIINILNQNQIKLNRK